MRAIVSYLIIFAFLVAGDNPAIASSENSWPLKLRGQMLRLAEVDWRLRIAAGKNCPHLASGIGVLIDHSGAYASLERTTLRRTLRLGNLPQVSAVVPNSPASLAGFRPGDEIIAIGPVSMPKALSDSPDKALFAEEVMDMIAALPAGDPTTILLRRGKVSLLKTVVPVSICSARTILQTDPSLGAYSDSNDLAVTSALIDFTENDDELALIIGHELAHVLMQNKQQTESQTAEQDADILGASLAQCAGYDIRHAVKFWQRFEKQDVLRQARLATHPSPAQREERLLQSIADFTCPMTFPTK